MAKEAKTKKEVNQTAGKSRYEELVELCKNPDGSYKEDADPNDLAELAKLEVDRDTINDEQENDEGAGSVAENDGSDQGSDGTEQENDEGAEPKFAMKNSDPFSSKPPVTKRRPPKALRKYVKKGYKYCGVDENGVHILHDDSGFWRFSKDNQGNGHLDYICDALPKEYLEKL